MFGEMWRKKAKTSGVLDKPRQSGIMEAKGGNYFKEEEVQKGQIRWKLRIDDWI